MKVPKIMVVNSWYETSGDDFILRAVKHDTSEPCSFYMDRIVNVTVLERNYIPKYRVELLPK